MLSTCAEAAAMGYCCERRTEGGLGGKGLAELGPAAIGGFDCLCMLLSIWIYC